MKPLFSPLRILQLSQDTVKPSGYLGTRQWVISRSLCFYKKFFLGNIPLAEQNSALDLRIRRWSPFQHTGRYVVWKNDAAMVWIWDEARRMEIAGTTGGKRWPVLPESLLITPPGDNILLIISCLEGFEVQIWKENVLFVSRWWKALPNKEQWAGFLLANDLDQSLPLPESQEFFWLDKPWAKSWDQNAIGGVKNEKLLVYAMAFIFTFWLSWNSVSFWRLYHSTKELDSQIKILTADIEPILAARTHALEQRSKAEKLSSLLDAPSQIYLMAKVAEVFPKKKVALKEWHYNHNKLSIMVEGKNQNPLVYVNKSQSLPIFDNVNVTQGRTQDILKITADVVKDRTP